MAVSESIARFLIVTLQHHHNLQLRYEIASFTHNRAGTNVFAFVASHADWFPIQRKTTGNDEPPSRKIELVDAGAVELYDLLAIDSISPSARKSVVSGKSVSVRVDLGGRSILKKTHNTIKQ